MTWHSFHPERQRQRTVDLTGQRFGLLTVLSLAPSLGHGARWRCRCECGAERVVRATDLRRGERATHRKCAPRPVAETMDERVAETDDVPAPWEEQAEWEWAP